MLYSAGIGFDNIDIDKALRNNGKSVNDKYGFSSYHHISDHQIGTTNLVNGTVCIVVF